MRKRSRNPVWDEELKFTNVSYRRHCLLTLQVLDDDRFPKFKRKDFLGEAQVDLEPLIQESYPMATGKKVVAPTSDGYLAKDSWIIQRNDGRIIQDVSLKLGGVKSGLLEIRLEWHPWQSCKPGIIVSTGSELWITSNDYPLRCEAFRN